LFCDPTTWNKLKYLAESDDLDREAMRQGFAVRQMVDICLSGCIGCKMRETSTNQVSIGAKDRNLIRRRKAMRHLLVAAVLGLTFAGNGFAQTGFKPLQPPQWGPGYRTPLSPYLKLTLPGDPATNYFLGTIPEFQRRQNAADFRADIEDLYTRDRLLGEELPRPRPPIPSGTYSLLNNTGGYFNNTGYYFGSPARPQRPIIRPGTYPPQAHTAGTPARSGMSPGFPPNPTFTPR
jgi:hypothetical protein